MRDPLLPKPTSLANWPELYRSLELPSINDMYERYVVAMGTGYEAWARDAFMIRAVLEQAVTLASIAEHIYVDAIEASEIALDSRSSAHHSLRPLQREVMFRAMDAFQQEKKNERREEARKRRAEKKAAESPQDPPPRKRRSTKGEAQAGESARASMKNPAATNREDISHVE